MGRRAWQATVCRVMKESDTTEQLSAQSNMTSVSRGQKKSDLWRQTQIPQKKKKKKKKQDSWDKKQVPG